jgi:2,4-dienoyl-CoA reductase-like NADH-dependent reductase (Old Yellow Enzyme family)
VPCDTSGRVTMETSPFPTLFSPFSIAGLELSNRIVMTAMGTRLSRDGLVGEADVAWLEERARGGVGLIVTGGQLPSASDQ